MARDLDLLRRLLLRSAAVHLELHNEGVVALRADDDVTDAVAVKVAERINAFAKLIAAAARGGERGKLGRARGRDDCAVRLEEEDVDVRCAGRADAKVGNAVAVHVRIKDAGHAGKVLRGVEVQTHG